jgi:hypothetical protein
LLFSSRPKGHPFQFQEEIKKWSHKKAPRNQEGLSGCAPGMGARSAVKVRYGG